CGLPSRAVRIPRQFRDAGPTPSADPPSAYPRRPSKMSGVANQAWEPNAPEPQVVENPRSAAAKKSGITWHSPCLGSVKMIVTCAWCQNEGRPAALGERAPLDNPAETHGICRRHTLDLLNKMPSRSFPGVRLLLVVGAKETGLYEHLQRELAGVSGVKVMLDRRRGDRTED